MAADKFMKIIEKELFVDSDKEFVGSDRAQGFTAVELLVSMSLFVVLIGIASGIFIRATRTQRQITALIAANSNASLAIEQIAREIRTGRNFCGGGTCPAGELNFINARGQSVNYKLGDGSNNTKSIFRVSEGKEAPITADNVNVSRMVFVIVGQAPGDSQAPRITLALQVGAAGVPFSESFNNFQTTLSPRVIEGE